MSVGVCSSKYRSTNKNKQIIGQSNRTLVFEDTINQNLIAEILQTMFEAATLSEE